jgi:hypothetical protein
VYDTDARSVPGGWQRIDRDLNCKAGGRDIFLITNRERGAPPVDSIVFIWADRRDTTHGLANAVPAGYRCVDVNLQEGAKGRPLYLCYHTGAFKY